MNMEQTREYVANLYSTQTWKDRVQGMEDDQIIAIYLDSLRTQRPKTTTQPKQLRLF